MRKTLSLLLALVLVIGLFPVFADDNARTQENTGARLKDWNALKGGSDGDLMISQKLKRQDAVIILARLMGKEDEAKAFKGEVAFKDIKNDFYNPFIGFAQAQKWIQGRSESSFGYDDVIKAQELAAMMLRALGYTDYAGEKYAQAWDKATELGLLKDVSLNKDDEVLRGISFLVLDNTLNTNPKDGDKALKVVLKYVEEPKPTNLAVTSADANGLKVIDLKFSKEVDENSLSTISLMKGKSKKAFTATLSEDKMTARLVLSVTAAQNEELTLKVEKVKTADGKETVEKFEDKLTMVDQVTPEVTGVEVLNPKMVKVMTSEPMNLTNTSSFSTYSQIELDGKAQYGRVTNANDNSFIFEFYKVVKAGDYKFNVKGVKDYAGFTAKAAEFDITVVEDKDAPKLVEATYVNTKELKVKFDEPLSVIGSFKVDGNAVTAGFAKAADKQTVKLTLSNALTTGAIVDIKVEYKGQKDVVGNEVKEWTPFNFKIDDDATLPTVELKEVKSSNVVLQFSKNMKPGTGYYTLKKADKVVVGKTQVTAAMLDESKLTIPISYLAGKDAAKYTLVLEDFVDATVRANALGKQSVEFEGKDTNSPEVSDKKFVFTAKTSDSGATVKIYFTEAMDESTLTNLQNYTFTESGTDKRGDLYSGLSAEVQEGGKAVLLTFASDYAANVSAVKVEGLKDLAGNVLKSDSKTLSAYGTGTAPTVNNGTADHVKVVEDKDGNQFLKFVFSTDVRNFDFNKFKAGTSSLAYDHGSNKEHYFVVPAKYKDDISALADGTAKPAISVEAGAFENLFGTKNVAIAAVTLDDGLGAKLVKGSEYTLADTNATIVFNFTENVNTDKTKHTVVVKKDGQIVNGSVTAVATNKVTFTPSAAFEAGSYTVELSIEDLEGNVSNLTANFTAEQAKAPVPTTLEIAAGTNAITVANGDMKGTAATTITDWATGSKDQIQVNFAASDSETAKLTVTGNVTPVVTDATDKFATDLTIGAKGNITIKVVVSKEGFADRVYERTIDVQ